MSWRIDPAHSHIQFAVRHMMISTVRGEFERFGGTISFDPENPEQSEVSVRIDAASINTRQPDRDAHLRSADFFNAEEYPVILFESKRIETAGTNSGRVIGDMTIRGVTREVVLDVEYAGMARSPWGATSAGFSATTTLDRKDWGLTWNQALETGGVLVGDRIRVSIEVEIIRQEEVSPAAAAVN
jgi:polyisoprenoid-binding protein YceI